MDGSGVSKFGCATGTDPCLRVVEDPLGAATTILNVSAAANGVAVTGTLSVSSTTALNGAVTLPDNIAFRLGTDVDLSCVSNGASAVTCTSNGVYLDLAAPTRVVMGGTPQAFVVHDTGSVVRFQINTSTDTITGTAAQAWTPSTAAIDTVMGATEATWRYVYLTAAGVDITLPDASGSGRLIFIKSISGTGTVVGDGSDTLEQGAVGTETTLTAANSYVELQDRANETWSVVRP